MKEQIIEKWSTLKEVQEYLGVGRDTILQWLQKEICLLIRWAASGNLSYQKLMIGFAPEGLLMTILAQKINETRLTDT